ncbi:hypothetical protein FW778_00170 [Ginsengibacter hankyongi]|uniref:Uncharacterized protein n=1 Tax=Ginsengibacter hankyongi TaxID=2607284 RepID=A0A5J5IKY9_9BACT|nr:hypothetical protein [Ginsengibacter hankyongi]KAA9040504.1 hypothetical protein FW778_00170 [Ginsengibacter hankyongi]
MNNKFFKQYFNAVFVAICILFSETGSAQLSLKLMGDDGIPHNLEFHDASGTSIPIGDRGDIGGSPLFKDQWGFAILHLKNGLTFSDSTVGFSLYNGRLFFKKEDKIYSVDYPVKAFLFEFAEDSDKEKIFRFQNGFPIINENDSLTFYEILFGGTSFKLLKLLNKKVHETYDYGVATRRVYYLYQQYFIFLPNKNIMIDLGINPTVKNLRKKLPKFSDQIKSYGSTHKLDSKNDDNLIQLFSFLDWEALNKSYAYQF